MRQTQGQCNTQCKWHSGYKRAIMKMPQDVHSSASVDAAHNKVLAAGSVLEFASPDNPCHSHGGRQLYTRPAFQRFPDRVAVMGRCHIPNVCVCCLVLLRCECAGAFFPTRERIQFFSVMKSSAIWKNTKIAQVRRECVISWTWAHLDLFQTNSLLLLSAFTWKQTKTKQQKHTIIPMLIT